MTIEFRANLEPELELQTADEFFDVIESVADLANEYTYAVQDACLCFLRVDTCEASLKREYPSLHPTPLPTLIPTPLPSPTPTLNPTPLLIIFDTNPL